MWFYHRVPKKFQENYSESLAGERGRKRIYPQCADWRNKYYFIFNGTNNMSWYRKVWSKRRIFDIFFLFSYDYYSICHLFWYAVRITANKRRSDASSEQHFLHFLDCVVAMHSVTLFTRLRSSHSAISI